MSQQFGGSWTDQKMKIVVDYAKAYLTIMAKQSWIKTIYFDGFAGSGMITDEVGEEMKKGTALQILEIDTPKPFDLYILLNWTIHTKVPLKKRLKKITKAKEKPMLLKKTVTINL